MLACMISSTVNLIPWVIPKVSGHCDNTMLAITTSVDMKKIQNSKIYQPAKNCEEKCGGGYYGRIVYQKEATLQEYLLTQNCLPCELHFH